MSIDGHDNSKNIDFDRILKKGGEKIVVQVKPNGEPERRELSPTETALVARIHALREELRNKMNGNSELAGRVNLESFDPEKCSPGDLSAMLISLSSAQGNLNTDAQVDEGDSVVSKMVAGVKWVGAKLGLLHEEHKDDHHNHLKHHDLLREQLGGLPVPPHHDGVVLAEVHSKGAKQIVRI